MDYKKNFHLGIGLNLFSARAILLRGDGKILSEVEKNCANLSANQTLEVLIELITSILEKNPKHKDHVKSAGIALGGIINSKKGIVNWPQKQDSSYVYISLPLKDYLEKKFGFPVFIENDANACAVAEQALSFPKYKNLIYMFSGVGCGIIAEGKLYRGKDGKAGEVFLKTRPFMKSPLGEFSFLRQWNADMDVVKRAKEFISMGHPSSLIGRISATGELELSDIFQEAKRKDELSRHVLKEAAFSLGVKIAFLVNLLNPEIVVLGGGFEKAGDFFLEECEYAMNLFAFSEMARDVKLASSGLGKSAVSLGAALMALEQTGNSDN